MRQVLYNQGIEVNSFSLNVDTVTIEWRQTTAPYSVVHSYTGLLQTNCTIKCMFANASEGSNYYIVLKDRNALETWSGNPIAIGSNEFQFGYFDRLRLQSNGSCIKCMCNLFMR